MKCKLRNIDEIWKADEKIKRVEGVRRDGAPRLPPLSLLLPPIISISVYLLEASGQNREDVPEMTPLVRGTLSYLLAAIYMLGRPR